MDGQQQNGWGIAGFTIGLCAVLLSLFVWFISPIFSILGLIFSIIQIRKNRTGLAIAGLILSIIALIIFVVFAFLTVSLLQGNLSFNDPCMDQPAGSIREFCYINHAYAIGKWQVCEKIENTETKDSCLKGVAEKANDKSICDKIVSEEIRNDCYSVLLDDGIID
jgi:hypothetical protein